MAGLRHLRWLLLFSGILAIILGVYLLSSPLTTLVSIAIYIGMAMLISGISEISSFFATEKHYRTGWVLVSGIISTLLGLWVMIGRGTVALVTLLPILVTAWIIFNGVTRMAEGFAFKAAGVTSWGWVFAFGLLSVIAGFVLIFHPMYAALLIANLVAISFIVHGVSNVTLFWRTRW